MPGLADNPTTRQRTVSPVHKQRPLCRYYSTPRGCVNGSDCRFLHVRPGEDVTNAKSPHDAGKVCRFFAAGYCLHGDKCWYKHAADVSAKGSNVAPTIEESPEASANADAPTSEAGSHPCAICFEDNPVQYGLLIGCSHPFCLSCIRNWRSPIGKDTETLIAGVIKTCPYCRSPSKFITPSSQFFHDDDPRKAAMIKAYQESMARVPCRYFTASPANKRFCPYGSDCFYQHLNLDGSRYQFAHGVDSMMIVYKERLHRTRAREHFSDLAGLTDDTFHDLLDDLRAIYVRNATAGSDYGDDIEEEEEEDDEMQIDEWRQLASMYEQQAARRLQTDGDMVASLRFLVESAMAQGDHDEGSVSPESSRAASDFEGLPPLEPISPLMSPSPENIAVDSSDQPPYLLLNASSSAPQLHPALRGDFGLRDSHSSIFRSRSDREELDNTPPTSPTPTNWEARALSPSPRPLSPSIRPLRSLSLPVFDGFITDDPIWDPSSPRSPRLSYLSTPVTSPRTQPLPPPRECSPLPSNPPSQRPNTQLNKNAEPFRPRSQQVARPQSPPRRAMSSSGRDSDKHGITSWPAGWAALSASSSLSPDTPPKDVSNDDHSKTISSSILRSRTPNVSTRTPVPEPARPSSVPPQWFHSTSSDSNSPTTMLTRGPVMQAIYRAFGGSSN